MDWTRFDVAAEMALRDDGNGIHVAIVDAMAAQRSEAVYVWLDAAGQALRIGTAKTSASNRLLQYNRYINKALAGLKSQTPLWEANAWLDLVRTQTLKAVVHQPDKVMTVVGEIRPYLDVERHLIAELKPSLNRSHR